MSFFVSCVLCGHVWCGALWARVARSLRFLPKAIMVITDQSHDMTTISAIKITCANVKLSNAGLNNRHGIADNRFVVAVGGTRWMIVWHHHIQHIYYKWMHLHTMIWYVSLCCVSHDADKQTNHWQCRALWVFGRRSEGPTRSLSMRVRHVFFATWRRHCLPSNYLTQSNGHHSTTTDSLTDRGRWNRRGCTFYAFICFMYVYVCSTVCSTVQLSQLHWEY